MKVRLYRNLLTYSGLTVHTASSGPVQGLDTLHLELDDGTYRAIGETRINCAYLNGYEPDHLLECACEAAGALDWSGGPEDLRAAVASSALPPPVKMLFDIALWDLSAKRAGLPLAHLLAGEARALGHATNQTLFLSARQNFDALAAAYVARGFRELKLRIGDDIDDDLAHLSHLRATYGTTIELAADANGAWAPEAAAARLAALAEFKLGYIEQPIAAGDWEALTRLAQSSPMPVMLDESLATMDDVRELIARRDAAAGRFQGHLKLIKLGGVTPVFAAARQLASAGVPFMIGQMNEGAVATASAMHVAVATRPIHAELYGADGLVNDPAVGLTYADGYVASRDAPGLGVVFRAPCAPIFSGD